MYRKQGRISILEGRSWTESAAISAPRGELQTFIPYTLSDGPSWEIIDVNLFDSCVNSYTSTNCF